MVNILAITSLTSFQRNIYKYIYKAYTEVMLRSFIRPNIVTMTVNSGDVFVRLACLEEMQQPLKKK